MHIFQRSTVLAAKTEEVYAFHENPHNIRKISPAFLQVVDVQAQTMAKQDDAFTLKLRIFGFPFIWAGTWASVNQPTLLVDTASLFPFRNWRHEHCFESIPNGTRMTDIVTYSIAFGILGQLLGATFFRLQLILMFAARHQATRNYFSSK